MSLTEAEHIFGGIHEDGLNDFLRAILTTRPHYLNYGSPGFVPATTVAATQMPTIPFPGVPGGIDWAVHLDIPVIDLHPKTLSLPPELSLGPGQVSVRTTVQLCFDCRRKPIKDEKPKNDREEPPRGEAKGPCFKVEVFAIGHLERTYSLDGDALVVVVDDVELVDIEPNELESVIECLLLQILRAVLADIRLPLRALRVDAFTLTLTRGPEVEDDQVKVYGNV